MGSIKSAVLLWIGMLTLAALAHAAGDAQFQSDVGAGLESVAQEGKRLAEQKATDQKDFIRFLVIRCQNPGFDTGYHIDVQHYPENHDFMAWVCRDSFVGCVPIGTPGNYERISVAVLLTTDKDGVNNLSITSRDTPPSIDAEITLALNKPDELSGETYFPGKLKTIEGKTPSTTEKKLLCLVSRAKPKS